MKIDKLIPSLNHAFNYVILTSKNHNIDESHALKHSMETLHFAKKIYNHEIHNYPFIKSQQDVIFLSAILHDMCDKKYMDENEGLQNIIKNISNIVPDKKIGIISDIISTMSYSKVKKVGYPNLHDYQIAYHIVRESDLLAAYDIDRCIIFALTVEKLPYTDAVTRAISLFDDRVLKYRDDNLFYTETSKILSEQLHKNTLAQIESLKKIYIH